MAKLKIVLTSGVILSDEEVEQLAQRVKRGIPEWEYRLFIETMIPSLIVTIRDRVEHSKGEIVYRTPGARRKRS